MLLQGITETTGTFPHPDLHWTETLIRLSMALLCGIAVGWEREYKERPAGIRTHALVAVGACAFTLLAVDLQLDQLRNGVQPNDILRVIDGIAGGIGFLGAGAIIQSRGNVAGLTTAAGIWVVAAIGAAAGLASYSVLGITAGFTLFTLFLLHYIEVWAFDGRKRNGKGSRDGKGEGDVKGARGARGGKGGKGDGDPDDDDGA